MTIFDLFGKKSKTPSQYNDTFPTPPSRQSEDERKPEPKPKAPPARSMPPILLTQPPRKSVQNLKYFPWNGETKTWDLHSPVIHYHYMIIEDLLKNEPYNKQEDLLCTLNKLLELGWIPPQEIVLKGRATTVSEPAAVKNSDEELDEDK